jgi:hypothetical protein
MYEITGAFARDDEELELLWMTKEEKRHNEEGKCPTWLSHQFKMFRRVSCV